VGVLELPQITDNWKNTKVVSLPGSVPVNGVLEAWGEQAAGDAEGKRRDF